MSTAANGEGGARPALSAARIAAAALALIDESGLDAFSMRKLGGHLGVDPMAVYHYVPSKAALFDLVVERIYLEIEVADTSGLAWDAALALHMRRARTAMRAHPGALPLMATRPVTTPAVAGLIETLAATAASAGATPIQALEMVNCLATYTVGHLLADVGTPVGGPEGPAPDVAALDPSALPTLAAAMMAGWDFDADATYEAGLAAMIAGFGARYELR